jgi:hypothetical protein
VQRELRDAALAVCRVELAGSARRFIEEQVGKAVAAEIARDDLRPGGAPVRVQRKL